MDDKKNSPDALTAFNKSLDTADVIERLSSERTSDFASMGLAPRDGAWLKPSATATTPTVAQLVQAMATLPNVGAPVGIEPVRQSATRCSRAQSAL